MARYLVTHDYTTLTDTVVPKTAEADTKFDAVWAWVDAAGFFPDEPRGENGEYFHMLTILDRETGEVEILDFDEIRFEHWLQANIEE